LVKARAGTAAAHKGAIHDSIKRAAMIRFMIFSSFHNKIPLRSSYQHRAGFLSSKACYHNYTIYLKYCNTFCEKSHIFL
jgi:hypothetical protein